MTVLRARRIAGKAWKVVPGGVTAYTVALNAGAGRVGSPVTVTVAPVGGVWPAAQVFAFSATTLSGAFSQASVTATAGTATPVTVTYTPTSAAGTSGTITATTSGLTNQSGAQPYSITATAATGYTLTQAANSGTSTQPHSLVLTPTPSGATWPNGATITLAAAGVAGAFSPGATVSLSGGTSAAATVTWTPSATGTATLSATNNAGLTNPSSLTYVVGASGAYTPPSDIIWSQPIAASTLMGNGGNSKPHIGQGQVVGGVGPFKWTTVSTVPDHYAIDGVTGCVYPPFNNIATAPTDTFDIKCTDGRGNFVQKTITIAKTGDPVLWIDQPWTLPANQSGLAIQVQPFATGHNLNDTVVLTDASGKWKTYFGGIQPKVGPLPAGSYPMTMTSTSSAGTLTTNFTINLVASTIGPALFSQNTISDSVPTGFVVGTFYCTTPNNVMTVTMTADTSGGKFTYDTTSRQIWTTGPLTAGSYSITLHVDDNGLTADFVYPITVQVGVTLASSVMTMTVNPSLINSGLGQVIGTPSVSGIPNGQWYMTQSCFNYISSQGFFGNPPPYAQDATTGQITNQALLSAQAVFGRPDDTLTLTKSDGITSCTKTFNIPVAEAPTTTVWVGVGMAAAHPGVGYETIFDCWRARLISTHANKILVKLQPGNYLGDGLGGDLVGPARIEGSISGGVWPVTGNHQSAGKAMWLIGDGDVELVGPFEVKDVHGASSELGLTGIRKDGNTAGNLLIDGVCVHDCDNGIQTGNGHTSVIIKNTEVYNCGTAHSGSGDLHNIYIGPMREAVVTNLVSHHPTHGHMFKCRAINITVTTSRFFDGSTGGSACCLDLPHYGNVTFTGNFCQHGPMSFNGYILQVGAEENTWPVNSLTSSGNVFVNMLQQGNPWDTPTAIAPYWRLSPQGVPSTATSDSDQFWSVAGGRTDITHNFSANQFHPPLDTDPTHATAITNSTVLALPPAIDLTSPWAGAASVAVPGPLYRKQAWNDSTAYANFNGVQQIPSVIQLRVAHTASAGTVLDPSIYATNTASSGAANPFGPGTTWSFAFDRVANPAANPNPWAPAGRYAVTANPDGTCTLKTGSVALPSSGVDFILLRATSPDGLTLCDSRYPIVVT